MFPIGSYPSIEWVLAEAVASGCTDIAVVIGPRKSIIKEYLTTCCPKLAEYCQLSFLVQSEPFGLGHALILAREFCAGHPVAVLLPDNLVAGSPLPLVQIADSFLSLGGAVFTLVQESPTTAKWAGRLQLHQVDRQTYAARPQSDRRTSVSPTPQLAGFGRYLLSPECLDQAQRLWHGPRIDELDDSLIFQHMVAAAQPVHGVLVEGQCFDISTVDGYIAAWQTLGRGKPAAIL